MQYAEQQFTIEELARLIDLPVRTIRYYITEGLLPGPGARGKAALYGEEHLLKLRLIRRLSERRVPLAEMQALLPDLSLAEVRELLEEEERRAKELEGRAQDASAKEYIEKLLKNAQTERQTSSFEPSTVKLRRHTRPSPQPAAPSTLPVSPMVPPPAPSSPMPATETWHRWELAPGVELHIRSDAEYRQRSLIERLFSAVGMIFRPTNR